MPNTTQYLVEHSLKHRTTSSAYRSNKSTVSGYSPVDVRVDLKLDVKDGGLDAMLQDLQLKLNQQPLHGVDAKLLLRMMCSVMEDAIEAKLKRSFSKEFDGIVTSFQEMLERRAAPGRDEAISRALSKARLRAEAVASVPAVDQTEACALLGLSTSNPAATLGQLEREKKILRFDWKAKPVYPLFQFDVTERRVYPALLKLMELRTNQWGGELALLHWLTRPNRSLGGAKPCDRLEYDQDLILRSFAAEISEPLNG